MKYFLLIVSVLAAGGGAMLFGSSGLSLANGDIKSTYWLEIGGALALLGTLLAAWIGGGWS